MDIKKLVEGVDLVELIDETYELEPDGHRYWRSVEHDSLVVDSDRQKFYFNSRGLSGDAIDWCVLIGGLSFKEAVAYLGGVDRSFNPRPRPTPSKPVNMAVDAIHYHQSLLSHKARAMALQKERGLRLATILKARLGWYAGVMGGGWTIPYFVGDGDNFCSGIKVRLLQGDIRYRALPGSRFGLYQPVPLQGPRVFIVEGEIKLLHLVQLGGVAVATNNRGFRREWASKLTSKSGLVIYAIRDNDLGGLIFLETVRSAIPGAIPLAPHPSYKGVDDWIVGARITDLDQLIEEGLCYV